MDETENWVHRIGKGLAGQKRRGEEAKIIIPANVVGPSYLNLEGLHSPYSIKY